MSKTFKVLSALLSYPTAELQEAARDLPGVLETEDLLPPPARQALAPLIIQLAERDLFDLQERYVLLFDRTRSLSLHLFEHVHGESRERGQAMVDLAELYARGGLEISARELPDYLPLFLEFLSTRPLEEARALLGEASHIVSTLAVRLRRRKSVYAAALRALEGLVRGVPDAETVQALAAEPEDDPDDYAALDAAWEETAVMFGPGAPADDGHPEACPRVDEILARMAAEGPTQEPV